MINPKEKPALAGIRAQKHRLHRPGGLHCREASLLCEALGGLRLAAIEITLYDPTEDKKGRFARKIIELVKRML